MTGWRLPAPGDRMHLGTGEWWCYSHRRWEDPDNARGICDFFDPLYAPEPTMPDQDFTAPRAPGWQQDIPPTIAPTSEERLLELLEQMTATLADRLVNWLDGIVGRQSVDGISSTASAGRPEAALAMLRAEMHVPGMPTPIDKTSPYGLNRACDACAHLDVGQCPIGNPRTLDGRPLSSLDDWTCAYCRDNQHRPAVSCPYRLGGPRTPDDELGYVEDLHAVAVVDARGDMEHPPLDDVSPRLIEVLGGLIDDYGHAGVTQVLAQMVQTPPSLDYERAAVLNAALAWRHALDDANRNANAIQTSARLREAVDAYEQALTIEPAELATRRAFTGVEFEQVLHRAADRAADAVADRIRADFNDLMLDGATLRFIARAAVVDAFDGRTV